MSAVVETWMGELSKLREKVRARKPFRSGGEAEEEKEAQQESSSSSSVHTSTVKSRTSVQKETTLSESTVCLLMDRFVPW
ncbi:hypothetical protein L1049_014864 [Liquidambar formosana]|uniref:Uncharacterized protein n=1 Tax=Liquidambar formosana TaxID=63359 RepID=A0AAP0RX75_LIQFO